MRELLEFTCSECQGHEFEVVDLIGRCRSCGHEWRRTDDYVYFVLTRRFTSPKEYARYRNGSARRNRRVMYILLVVLWLASILGALRVGP